MRFAVWILDADDEHVLCQPALGARLPAGNAQRVTFFSEQRIAAIAGAEALDAEFLGEVHDETPFRIEVAGGVQPLDETTFLFYAFQCGRAHARHDLHVGDYIRAVGNFHAAAWQWRSNR